MLLIWVCVCVSVYLKTNEAKSWIQFNVKLLMVSCWFCLNITLLILNMEPWSMTYDRLLHGHVRTELVSWDLIKSWFFEEGKGHFYISKRSITQSSTSLMFTLDHANQIKRSNWCYFVTAERPFVVVASLEMGGNFKFWKLSGNRQTSDEMLWLLYKEKDY